MSYKEVTLIHVSCHCSLVNLLGTDYWSTRPLEPQCIAFVTGRVKHQWMGGGGALHPHLDRDPRSGPELILPFQCMMTHSYTIFPLHSKTSSVTLTSTILISTKEMLPLLILLNVKEKGANCHNRRLSLYPYQATFPHIVPICTKNSYPGLIIIYSHKTGFLFNMEWIDSLM